MSPVIIVIPGDAVGKGRPRATKAGRLYTPEKTRTREGVVATIAIEAMQDRAPIEGPVHVEMRVQVLPARSKSKKWQAAALTGEIRPTGRPDLDNTLKLVLDACNRVVYRDDDQVVSIAAAKVYGPQAMTVVTISEVA